ncbi:S24 family peptidase [Seleniivibrio sp.]|uniref:S24 family peptidase n=1 Tax=Seleniivibrio sp. TaxID=2898801 RepID=UPI00341CCE63
MLESENQASAGYGAYNSNEPVGQISLDRVFIEKGLRANYKLLASITVVGDSMEPTLRNGDVVIVDNSQTGGDGIFIVRAGEVLYIKRVQIFFDKGIMRLTSDNGFYEPMELDVKTDNVKVVGRVICCLRKI